MIGTALVSTNTRMCLPQATVQKPCLAHTLRRLRGGQAQYWQDKSCSQLSQASLQEPASAAMRWRCWPTADQVVGTNELSGRWGAPGIPGRT